MKKVYQKPEANIRKYNISSRLMDSSGLADNPVYDLQTKDGVQYTLGTLNQ